MENEELKWVYQTILSGPGMGENVKLSFSLSRKLLLVLSEIIETGLNEKKGAILNCVAPEQLNELAELRTSFLEKSDLLELSNQLQKQ